MSNPPENFPTALIFSELDDLSFGICRQILKEKCLLKIICKNKKAWTLAIAREGLQGAEVITDSQAKNLSPLHYVIYQLNFFKLSSKNLKDVEKETVARITLSLNIARGNGAKALVLLPAQQFSLLVLKQNNKRLEENGLSFANTVLFGETLGPYFQPSAEGFFGNMVRLAAKGVPVEVREPDFGVPLSSSASAAQMVVRLLFSFGRGQQILIEGPSFSAKDFFQKLLARNPSLVSKQTSGVSQPKFVVKQTIFVNGPSNEDFSDGLSGFGKQVVSLRRKKEFLDETKKGILSFAFSFGLFLVLPYFILFGAAGLLFGAGVFGLKQNFPQAQKLIAASQGAAGTSNRGFSLLIKLPLGKQIFGPGLFASDLLQRSANAGLHATSALESLETISERFFADEPYEVAAISDQLFLEVDFVYRELGFLQGEIGSLEGRLPAFIDQQKALEAISEAREKISLAKAVIQEFPWILGDEQKRVYLLLFQNNMELRPTGGYIGSFAVVSVEKGRLVGIDIQDVFSADGQLKGHVEPPAPIKKYLGEAGWYLRDSNWDPEFSVSAQRAEWFLDKELGIGVDGVVSLDLEAVKKFLDVVGEVEVVDFSKTITSKNLYEETRAQIEQNFFPGSRTKANFLMALTSSLLTKISDPGGADSVRLGRAAVSSFEERNAQVFLHNGPALKALEDLGWTGGLPNEVCPNPCFGDWTGLAEANVGVNKANYFIERNVDLSILLKEGEVKRTLTITWKNNASKQMGEKGRYEVYVRALAPRGNFAEGQKKIGQNFIGFSPEIEFIRGHIEAGTIVEVFPEESSAVSFSWTSPAEIPGEKGEYFLLIRKQAGTMADRWEIEIDNQLGRKIELYPEAILTGVNTFRYNTTLARDFVSRIYW